MNVITTIENKLQQAEQIIKDINALEDVAYKPITNMAELHENYVRYNTIDKKEKEFKRVVRSLMGMLGYEAKKNKKELQYFSSWKSIYTEISIKVGEMKRILQDTYYCWDIKLADE